MTHLMRTRKRVDRNLHGQFVANGKITFSVNPKHKHPPQTVDKPKKPKPNEKT